MGAVGTFIQTIAFGVENVSYLTVSPAIVLGASLGTVIAWLIIRHNVAMLERVHVEQETAARLKREIAGRIRTEEELHKISEQYQQLTELSPDAVFVHDGEKIVFVNPAMVSLMGARSAEELIGMPAIEIVHRDWRPQISTYRQEITRTGNPKILQEVLYGDLAGNTVYVESAASPARWDGNDAILVVARDISARKATEAALRRSEQAFRDFAGAVSDRFWECDREGRFTRRLVAPDADNFLTEADFIGKTYWDIHGDQDNGAGMSEIKRSILAGEAFRNCDIEILPVRGRRRYRRISGVPFYDEKGELAGFRGVAQDVTEQRHTEEQLVRAQKLEAVGQLTGGIAHDFNNMMMVVQINARLLARACTGKQKEQIDLIQYAANRCTDLTRRLLAFSRQQPLRAEVLDMAELCHDMHDLLERTLGETIEVTICTADVVWPAMADRGQVENALLNLAINARDAMPDGGKLTITCANETLDDAAAVLDPEVTAGEYAVLIVSDTGTGMPDDVRRHAFEPFFTTKEVGHGTGLGLSTIYGFAKQSGGHVTIDSKENRGTIVRLYLPRAQQEENAGSTGTGIPAREGRGEHILVIEDEAAVRAVTVTMLKELNYRVTDVANASDARRIMASGEKPDVILSDVVLPGGTSGYEFAKEMRSRWPAVRIVFMSGYPEDAAQGDDDRPDGFLLKKPFDTPRLASAIRQALNRDRGLAPARSA